MPELLDTLIKLDKEVFLFLNGLHNSFMDQVMFYISEKWLWIPLYIFFLYLIWKNYKRQTWIILLAVAVLITLTDQIHLHLFKNMFERLRPTHDPSLEGMVHTVNNYYGGKFGFVSGHASNSFAIATFLSVLLGTKYKCFTPLLLVWAVLISYSRIYLGVHFPGDVLGGTILGSCLGIFISTITISIINKNRHEAINP
ncbi:MAG: phosphatase PAP2 family protein [Bacteroidales bacterium]|nr:phosphatase PAP2 family protein [Bacteroidales bacterium]MCF8388915.1 phosphatase PAP2 family protein [Bacteroidales bacterium]MCF8399374.1 phosphatase PAP2 family protein [Bacteroidales bacterium]